MSEQQQVIQHYILKNGLKMAYQFAEGEGPCFVFLPGYMSDMDGGKAQAVMVWARENGRACLLLDYTGCGHSEGDFADGTLSKWRDEVLELIQHLNLNRCVLIGSSMGGWLMLMLGLALGERLAGIVGIAAAPDFTSWGFDDRQKAKLADGAVIYEDNAYGYDPTPTYAKFWRDGEAHLMLNVPIPITAPVRLLHGQMDADVPFEISLRLAASVESADVRITLIKDGDHRLSRDGDVAVLLSLVADMYG